MFRLIGIVIALAVVAWLATRQLDATRSATREAAETAGEAGVDVDARATPREIAEQFGSRVEAQVQDSKARVDELERASQ